MLENVSIIIPASKEETAFKTLLQDLEDTRADIIIVQEGSRAQNMNIGAERATQPFLWFLHADTHVTKENILALEKSIHANPDALHYFNLAFDGKRRMKINAWGANWRSRLFGTPYGDQGFCLSKKNFIKAGRYKENLPRAEDLMFVWQARQKGIPLKRTPSALLTSSCTYEQHGWWKITLYYQWVWIKMSIPEAWKLLRRRKTT